MSVRKSCTNGRLNRHQGRQIGAHETSTTNQICVYRYDDGNLTGRTKAYIVEYKAPHKLTLPHLRLGLRPMNIYKEVVNRAIQPTAEEAEACFSIAQSGWRQLQLRRRSTT